MKVVLPLVICGLVIVGLLYRAVGAYLRDRARFAEQERQRKGGEG